MFNDIVRRRKGGEIMDDPFQVKILTAPTAQDLERRVNEWLKDSCGKIGSIHHFIPVPSGNNPSSMTMTIVYQIPKSWL